MEQKPSLGRIVLVKPHGHDAELPAIVTRVHSEDCINVAAFLDNSSSVMPVSSCTPQETNPDGYGWRWPPRV